VPVVVVSARRDEFDKVAALQLGADGLRHQALRIGGSFWPGSGAVLRARAPRRPHAEAASESRNGEVSETPPASRLRAGVLARSSWNLDTRNRCARGAARSASRTSSSRAAPDSSAGARTASTRTRTSSCAEVWGHAAKQGSAYGGQAFWPSYAAKLELDPEPARGHLLTVSRSGYRFVPE